MGLALVALSHFLACLGAGIPFSVLIKFRYQFCTAHLGGSVILTIFRIVLDQATTIAVGVLFALHS